MRTQNASWHALQNRLHRRYKGVFCSSAGAKCPNGSGATCWNMAVNGTCTWSGKND